MRSASALLVAVMAALAVLLAPPVARAEDSLDALYAAAKKEDPMTWYISLYGQEIAQRVVDAFAKKYPGLKVVAIRRTTGSTFQRIDQDLRAKSAIASVITMSGISDYYPILKKGGNLLEFAPQNAAKLEAQVQSAIDPGYVYPVGGGLMVICYNSKNVAAADVPKTWDDLLDPKWKGKLALSHPAFSGFDAALDVALTQQKGWAYFEKIAKNDPLIQRSTFDTITALNSGERAVASMPDGVAMESVDKGNPLALVYPADGSVMIMGFTAILKNAPQPNTAKLFTEFLLGTEHMQIEADSHYVSIRPEVVTKLPDGRSLNDIKIIPLLPSGNFAADLTSVIDRWRNLFGG
jgi:iron(III) transport system substrate-binding protein